MAVETKKGNSSIMVFVRITIPELPQEKMLEVLEKAQALANAYEGASVDLTTAQPRPQPR